MKRYQILQSGTDSSRRTALVFEAAETWHEAEPTELSSMFALSTLHDYRVAHPYTAGIPTMTQGNWLGMVLARQQRKAARLARRRALWRKVLTAPARAMKAGWQGVKAMLHVGPAPATAAAGSLTGGRLSHA